jgi:hypothetical protein
LVRRYVAVETQEITVDGGEHIVKFYEDDRELVDAVLPYLTAAALSGEAMVVIATEAHRRAFEAELDLAVLPLADA